MLNVKTLTDTMSRMQLPQLQQYATLHKNDPYIVTLALSIANQKKQMKAGQEGQAGMQPQPKVADQQIAQMVAPPPQQGMAPPQQQMLPEDQGIGQLPAQNMQGMAEGGIVAFGPGGSTGEEDLPEWLKAFPPESGVRRTYREAKQYDKNNPMPLSATDAYLKSVKENASNTLPAGTTFTPPGMPAAQTGAGTLPPGAGSAPPPGAGAVPPPGAGAPIVKPVKPVDPMAGITALDTTAKTPAQAKAEAAALSDSTELRGKLEANESFTTKAYDKLLGDYDKKVSEMPEAYKGYEERLKKEEAEAATDKDKALGMSIFQAGLGMMSGTSQYAFENIGKGALAGLDNYQSALKDLKKAQRERDKAFGDIEAARNAEKRGDLKAHTELQAKGIDALGTAKNRTIEGIAKIFQVDTDTAKGIFETKLKENAQNERTMFTAKTDFAKQAQADAAALQRTQIQANAPTGLERIYRNPELFNKHMEAQTAATGMRGDDALIAPYMKDPTALVMLEKTHPELAAQIKQKIQMRLLQPQTTPGNVNRQ
jgi:hypothetical protein